MGVVETYKEPKPLERCLQARCRELKAPVAVVGTGNTAKLLISALTDADVKCLGVYENKFNGTPSSFEGFPVQPLEDLAKLNPNDIVVVASTASPTSIHEIYSQIQDHCSCKVIEFKSLLDIYETVSELKGPLDFKFDKFFYDRLHLSRMDENYPWEFLPQQLDLKDKVILELGPFEGHHTMVLMTQKPKKVIGIEARPSNFAKTSVIKSLLGWENFSLLLGDMHLFPGLVQDKLDVIFCSGVFYHSDKPWWFLQTCMENCDTIILLGHVSSEHSVKPVQYEEVKLESGTYQFEVYEEKGDNLSGTKSHSLWFKEEDLIRFFDFYGFSYERYFSEVNPYGLWIGALVTRKK